MFELPFCTPLYYALDETAYWLVEDPMARPITKLPVDYHITEYPCGCEVAMLNEKVFSVAPCSVHLHLTKITGTVEELANAIVEANRGHGRLTGIGGSIPLG